MRRRYFTSAVILTTALALSPVFAVDFVMPPDVAEKAQDMIDHPENHEMRPATDQELEQMRLESTLPCPNRDDGYRVPKQDFKGQKISVEWACAVGDTWLLRHNVPDKTVSPDLLNRYLRHGKYSKEKMPPEEYLKVMEEAIKKWPKSRYSHEGLYSALLGMNGTHVNAEGVTERTDSMVMERAAKELIVAAEIALNEGEVIWYANNVRNILVETNNKAELQRFFEKALQKADSNEQFVELYTTYGIGLEEFNDPYTDYCLREAIKYATDDETEGQQVSFYAQYLLRKGKWQEAVDYLKPGGRVQKLMEGNGVPDVFHRLRCQALKRLNRHGEAAPDCQAANEQLSKMFPKGEKWVRLVGQFFEVLTGGAAWAAHNNAEDDCETNNGPPTSSNNDCEIHPAGGEWCYFNYVWNLAELITSEARSEDYGSRATVAWTVRNRAITGGSSACGQFPGSNRKCTSKCPTASNPTLCLLQRSLCCIVHSGQFAIQHWPTSQISIENVRLAISVLAGRSISAMTGFTPPHQQGTVVSCPFVTETGPNYFPEVCSRVGLTCGPISDTTDPDEEARNLFTADLEGPYYFYANCITTGTGSNKKTTCFSCRGFQHGPLLIDIGTTCTVTAGEVCPDSQDGVPPEGDTCYGRLSRVRKDDPKNTAVWFRQGDVQSLPNPSSSVNGGIRIGPNSYIYRGDTFKGGGKEIKFKAKLETSGASTSVDVIFANPVLGIISYLGSQAVTSTNSLPKIFTSVAPIPFTGNVVIIRNLGPTPVIIGNDKFVNDIGGWITVID